MADEYLKSEATYTQATVYYKSCAVCGLSSKGISDVTFEHGKPLPMLNIPTYEIIVEETTGGTVTSSLSNASKGSVIKLTATPDEGYELVYITVDGEQIKGSSFIMPEHDVTVSALFRKPGLPFTDVKAGDWFYDSVSYVYNNALMNGTSDTTFSPDATMTRGMLMTILARLDGVNTDGGATWYEKGMQWAVSKGISDGTNPEAPVTREQFATMLWRYAGSPETVADLNGFADGAKTSDWAYKALSWAFYEGIVNGMTETTIVPQGNATRATLDRVLMRYLEK